MFSKFWRLGHRPLGFLIFLTGVLVFQPAPASSVKAVGFEEMVHASELIFEGRVVESDAVWNRDGTAIRTIISFEVLDVIKGQAKGRVQLSFAGGTIGQLTLSVSDLHVPLPGEQGIYFVESTQSGRANPLYGWHQGHFLLTNHAKTGRELVLTANALPVVAIEPRRFNNKQLMSGETALGVKTVPRAHWRQALTKASFKASIDALVFGRSGSFAPINLQGNR